MANSIQGLGTSFAQTRVPVLETRGCWQAEEKREHDSEEVTGVALYQALSVGQESQRRVPYHLLLLKLCNLNVSVVTVTVTATVSLT